MMVISIDYYAKSLQILDIHHNLHLQQLINDFFALSIIDLEDDQLQLESIAINTIVQESLLECYDQFQGADRHPTIDMITEELIVIVDQTACKRVIENILFNVLRHSRGDFSVRLEKLGEQAVLEVKNNISNRNELQIDRVFDRFYTADKSRYRHGGIGLSIAQGLMKQMNGEVIADVKDGSFSIICKWPLVR